MKPDIIVRKDNKFMVDESKLLPYMRKHKDLVMAAVSLACQKLKDDPNSFSPNPIDKLSQLNSLIYDILKGWKVYKDPNEAKKES